MREKCFCGSEDFWLEDIGQKLPLIRCQKCKAERSEFRCPSTQRKPLTFYFKVLPIMGGHQDRTTWFYQNGAHFVDDERFECPRCHDGRKCIMCQTAFDFMNESNNLQFRKSIAQKLLARSYYAMNIYFINHARNPKNLRGRVMWYNAPHTVWDLMRSGCCRLKAFTDTSIFNPWASFTFRLHARCVGGYNDYSDSNFLSASKRPLVMRGKCSDDVAIAKILSQRHDLPSKFARRDPKEIAGLLEKR